jgi:hypothetical protein
MRDVGGYMGATVTLVVPRFLDEWEKTRDYKPLAWWLVDHAPDFDLVMFQTGRRRRRSSVSTRPSPAGRPSYLSPISVAPIIPYAINLESSSR